jgi:hypothetical protein
MNINKCRKQIERRYRNQILRMVKNACVCINESILELAVVDRACILDSTQSVKSWDAAAAGTYCKVTGYLSRDWGIRTWW